MNNNFKYIAIKRSFDVFFSLIGIIIFFIPVLIICSIVRFTSNGPFFHRAYRIGKYEKPFLILKIRTMNDDAPLKSFESIKSPEKFYIRFGKILRKSGIDELPQLYNILKGDMSLVGPRPTLFFPEDLISLRKKNNIYSVKPGLTGLAQINGRSKISSAAKVNLDKYYIENISLWFDLKILLRTVPSILKDFMPAKGKSNVLLKNES